MDPPPWNPTIALVNRSSLVSDRDVAIVAAAVGRQLADDVAPHSNAHPAVTAVAAGDTPPEGAWPVLLVDTLPDPFKVGYHDFADTPFAYVGVERAP